MSTELTAWDDEADVVVVGLGGAGIVSAIQAKIAGADVLGVDRFTGGGATAISGGVFYAGGGTHIQADAGVEDAVDEMYRYLKIEVKGIVSDRMLRDFCERSRQNLRFLEANGVPFEGSLCPVKTSYPTDKYYLYYSGNESFYPWTDSAKAAPRGHRAKGKGLPGASFYQPLRDSAEKLGVRIATESRVRSLITDDDGNVLGVEVMQLPQGSPAQKLHRKLSKSALKWKNYNPGYSKKCERKVADIEAQEGVRRRFRARRGVVLSAGGFIYNREMLEEFAPKYRPGMPLGTPGDDGSGIRLGESAGGQLASMNRVSAWRFINPPEAWTHGIIVNRKGRRYVNEQLYGAAIGEAMVEDNEGQALLIINKRLWKQSRSQVMWGRAQWFQAAPAMINLYFNTKKGKTISDLEKACKLPEGSLKKTLDEYNGAISAGTPDPFNKQDKAREILDGPFYAINASINSKRWPCPTLTLGGVVVDEQTGHVLREDGSRVGNLYGAGRNAVGICSRQYVSGLSIADCVYSGRRAGLHAATGEELADQSADVEAGAEAVKAAG